MHYDVTRRVQPTLRACSFPPRAPTAHGHLRRSLPYACTVDSHLAAVSNADGAADVWRTNLPRAVSSFTSLGPLIGANYPSRSILAAWSMVVCLIIRHSPQCVSHPFTPAHHVLLLPLANGHHDRVISTSAGRSTTFIIYNSTFNCSDGSPSSCHDLYILPQHDHLPDYTVVNHTKNSLISLSV